MNQALPDYRVERFSTRYGALYALADDQVIARSLRIYGEWAEHEIDAVSKWIGDGDGIIDVGANIGTHVLAFAKRFPGSTVLALEPQPVPCGLLVANVLLNELTNVRVANLGASDAAAVVPVHMDYRALDGNAGAFSMIAASANGGYPLVVAPLDSMELPPHLGFIKIDVEGMEPDVLRGAAKTLRAHRPVVYFEVLKVKTLALSRETLLAAEYELYWLETWPFNVNNVRGNKENVWCICEMGVVAFPRGDRRAGDLRPVTGDETELPFVRDPYAGYDARTTRVAP